MTQSRGENTFVFVKFFVLFVKAAETHKGTLVHPAHQGIDLVLSVAVVPSFAEVVPLLLEPTTRIRQFERPQKFVGLLEVGSNSEDFVDQILHADNAKLAQFAFNNAVGGDGDALSVDFSVTTFVNQLLDCFKVGVTGRKDK